MKQHLPNYKHDFEGFSEWKREDSPNYTFYFTKGSEAENDIQHIVTSQEQAFSKIVTTLGLQKPGKKIEYYLYPDAELKIKLMGDDWFAQSIYDEFRIHVLYTKDDKPIGPHEDTHLLTLPWGLSWNFIQEGLAEYMVGHCWDGTPHNQKLKEGILLGLDLLPSKQLSSEDWLNADDNHIIYYYALAGSWSQYLIESYGLNVYVDFYKNTQRDMPSDEIRIKYQECFKKSLDVMEQEFLSTLDK